MESGPLTSAAAVASSAPDTGDICRVIVVDDSATVRGLMSRALETQPDFRIVATASDGRMAVNSLKNKPADVIILDVEMPGMDGLTAIPLLKAVDPAVQIIMASSLTQKNAEISLKAMTLGATDYVPKPSASGSMADYNRELIEKARTLAKIARRKGVRASPEPSATPEIRPPPMPEPRKKITLRREPTAKPDIIAIGSSTGGPQALFEVIKQMGANLPQPVVITQHMPPSFTTVLAGHITRQCNVTCIEGKDGEVLKPSCYYLAPGDFHMLIEKKAEGAVIRLVKGPAENFCRPAVDPMLRSLAEAYKRPLVVMLTGMGQDGWKGSDAVVNGGGAVIAQDEATSVVWGMPGAVATAGLCFAVLPLDQIGAAVRQTAMRS